jgi:hypothetical protein
MSIIQLNDQGFLLYFTICRLISIRLGLANSLLAPSVQFSMAEKKVLNGEFAYPMVLLNLIAVQYVLHAVQLL